MTYTEAEGLAGTVRIGRDSPALIVLAPVWLLASAGTITVIITSGDTATLDTGRYLLELHLADDSADLYEGFLDVTYSAGTAAALTSYGAYSDLLDYAPWLEKLQRPTDLAGFARQRYKAREWFEDLLHRHYRGTSGISTDFAFVPGISFGGLYGGGVLWRDGRRSTDLQGWLDSNLLLITDQVVEAVSLYAIALLCERQVTPGKDDTGYGAAARKYFARAEAVAADISAELDTDNDGKTDTVIRLGSTDTLDG
jgi:hypothetical protein